MATWVRDSVNDNRDSDPNEDYTFYGMDQQFKYGYQWWVLSGERNGFTGIGKHGQFLHLFPDQNVVIVQLSDMEKRTPKKTCESLLVHRLIADQVAQ